MKEKRCKVAVIQAAPVLMDLQASTEKAVSLIAQAAEAGAELIVFPEAFLPAYPRGLSFGFIVGSRTMEGREDWKRYYDNAVCVGGKETAMLSEAAKKAGAYVVIGVIERDAEEIDRTLYCSVLFFGPDGSLLGTHRKLKPTGSERLIWGEGDGSGLCAIETPYGKMGALICWENYMPLARAAMYQKGVRLYIAPTADNREEWQHTVRHIALEGRCFVLSCNQYVTRSMYPHDLKTYDELAAMPEECCPGGSCIVDPYGKYVVEPVWGREEILLAELDLDMLTTSAEDMDVVGHYARPDVFQLLVDESKKV